MLLRERIRHTNRIRGLLFGQGITNYNPLHNTSISLRQSSRCGPSGPLQQGCLG